ncbi:hypothetical protein BH11ACT7_BH11ACT7_24810 [soil metagenome]
MRTSSLFLVPPLTALGVSAAVLFSPTAGALPQCQNISPQTTQCSTVGGSNRITTSPPATNYGTWPGWTYGYWGSPGYIVDFG